MFCPKCGTQLPDDAQFCASCGTRITSAPKVGTPGVMAPVGHRPKRKTLIVAAAVVVVAVVGVAIAFATGLLGGPKFPDGTISMSGGMYFQFDREGSDSYLTLGQAYTDGTKDPLLRGRLVRDGSNEDGTIWRLEDISSPTTDASGFSCRVQFPDGAADGKLAGAWKLSLSRADSPDIVWCSLYEFEEDGGAWFLTTGGGYDLMDRHYSYDEARALSENDGNAYLTDGLTWWPNGDNYQWGKNGYNYDITFTLS